MKLQTARILGKLEAEVSAGRMTPGDAVETLVLTTEVDADELDEARGKLRQALEEE